jgi:hypothetical protein
MAEKSNELRHVKTNVLNSGMNKDLDPQLLSEGQYTHAVNSQLNNHKGGFNFIQNEPSNINCYTFPTTYISSIPLLNEEFAVFLGDGAGNSEIGIFNRLKCEYTTVISDPCLNFDPEFPIRGISKENTDCSQSIYWADGNNPNRLMNLSNVPYKFTLDTDKCKTKIYSTDLDCEALRIDQLITVPCVDVALSPSGGKLTNGAYQVSIAYSIQGQRVTNLYATSLPVSIYSHQNLGGGVTATITNLDQDFDEYILYLIATVDATTTVYQMGTYGIAETTVEVNNINESLTIPLSEAFLQKVVYEKSRDVVTVDNRAMWIGAQTKAELNYQLDALSITAKWEAYRVPANYYRNGGTKVGYMRDEVYAFGIQWLFNTADYSPVYHIIGPASSGDDTSLVVNIDAYEFTDDECIPEDEIPKWKVYNTAKGGVSKVTPAKCDEEIVGSGGLGFWQSEELYPDNSELFGSKKCTNIRHFRMPDVSKVPYQLPNDDGIIVLGVKFSNIPYPKNDDGSLRTDISGYRIVRADRTNHKSIQGKGLLYNTAEYDMTNPEGLPGKVNTKALYPNYPYNDLRQDDFLSKKQILGGYQEKDYVVVNNHYKDDIFTFHSPSFAGFGHKFSFGTDLYIEGEFRGVSNSRFDPVYNLGDTMLLSDAGFFRALVFGIITGAKEVTDGLETINTVNNPAKLAASIANIVNAGYYAYLNGNLAIDTIYNFSKPRHFVYQVNSNAFYNLYTTYKVENHRRKIVEAIYLAPQVQNFQGFRVNNWERESSVLLKVSIPLGRTLKEDTSRRTMMGSGSCETKAFTGNVSSHYASIRRKLPSQYGQVDSIRYINTGYCDPTIERTSLLNTDTVFGGDTFLNRYSLKRKFKYFTQLPLTGTSNYDLNYRQYSNVLFTRFWMDTFRYDMKEFLTIDGDSQVNFANDKFNLDCSPINKKDGKFTLKDVSQFLAGPFTIDTGAMYSSNNGIVDFYVESEYNLDLRDYSDLDGTRHFDRREYTDLNELFRADILDIDNYNIYDSSYSKQLTENVLLPQSRYYDKNKADTCYTQYNNRVFWSQPYAKGQVKDSWGYYLTTNYFDFPSENGALIAAKSLTRTNIIFLFSNSAPWLHDAQDTLTTDGGVKVTIGDGGLFGRSPQPIVTTDDKYGNCQHRTAVTNTQFGLFYTSARQGRVFLLQGLQPLEISRHGMHWWFKENMPLKLVEQFPDFTNIDNPLTSIGFTSGFDNVDETYYLSKRDFKVKQEFLDNGLVRPVGNQFYFKQRKIKIGDSRYFDDCSWTVSYNPKTQTWISFHDWHPNSILQTETSLITSKDNTLWKHNETCSTYCNYYGTQYTWDIEYVLNNGQQTSTLSSIEYVLESYKYYNDCYDKHHLLDYNFNKAFIYNTEQCTGFLRLNMAAKNQITNIGYYPRVSAAENLVDIAYNKEEQKFRFNQFWDVIRDRGEFSGATLQLLVTDPNGYKYAPNTANLNFEKRIYERKKIRHNYNHVYFRREEKNNEAMNHMIFKFTNAKEIMSPR